MLALTCAVVSEVDGAYRLGVVGIIPLSLALIEKRKDWNEAQDISMA